MQPVIETFSIAEKRSLLANLLQNRSQLQLSPTQERLWQLCQMKPGTPVYNFQISLELEGRLHLKALEFAALQVVRRHDVLQIRYGMEKGKPALSLVPPPGQISITMHDISNLSQQEQESRIEALGMEDAQHSFDLNRPPLLRLTLIRLAIDKHRLYLTMHHIVSDFLSLDLFLFELGKFYSAVLQQKPIELSALHSGYQDFAKMKRSLSPLSREKEHLEYWRRTLADATPMEWFSDHVRPIVPTGKASTEFFNLPTDLLQQIETFASKRQLTPFTVLLAAFNILLHACSGREDLIVGSPMAGRVRSEYEPLIGMFSYPVLMRTKIARCENFENLLQRVRILVLEAAEHGNVPFASVAECIGRSGSEQGAILRAMFSYVSRLRDLHFEGLTCRRRPTNRGITDLDFFLTIYPDVNQWHGVFEYNTDLFEPRTIRSLIAAYLDILQAAVAGPEMSISELTARVPVKPPVRLTISATFTATPLLETLQFWGKELDLQFAPVISPYNQLFQQLIDPQSPLFSSSNALNVLLVRPEDWVRYVECDFEKQRHLLQQSAQDFITALSNALPRMSCPIKIYLCPASACLGDPIASIVAAVEDDIRHAFAGASVIEVLNSETCIEKYSVAGTHIHSPQTDRAANIPYQPAFYAALGTAIVRQLCMQISKPCKVLVLDCDNTLWQGLCAEDGSQGVVISEGHVALQKFALQQADSGVLLCLTSKNVEEHALAVFRQNRNMVLKESDISAHRINWEPKSSNLQSLAEQLQLGLDSFVFLDDDERECAEVAARCPEVVTIRLPHDPTEFPRFLRHLWIFDRESLSKEDRQRASFYRDNQRRDMVRQQAASLAEFLVGLNLQVDMCRARQDQILRIAELSERTTQFNSSGLSFKPLQLQAVARQGIEIMAIKVSDRFGEYGLVGAVVYQKDKESLLIQAFYLSCRVLGRGVEQRILSELGRVAQSFDLGSIQIQYKESARNRPFRCFLEHLPGRFEISADGSCAFVMMAADAVDTQLVLDEDEKQTTINSKHSRTAPSETISARRIAGLARLPHDLSAAAQVLARIDSSESTQRESRHGAFVAPHDGLEASIAVEWATILRMDKVGRSDNFFELGGNSLLLVQLNGSLISRLGIEVSVTEMLQYPTIASLATYLASQASSGGTPETHIRGMKVRTALQNRKRLYAARSL